MKIIQSKSSSDKLQRLELSICLAALKSLLTTAVLGNVELVKQE